MSESEMRGLSAAAAKCAASDRDDSFWGGMGEEQAMTTAGESLHPTLRDKTAKDGHRALEKAKAHNAAAGSSGDGRGGERGPEKFQGALTEE